MRPKSGPKAANELPRVSLQLGVQLPGWQHPAEFITLQKCGTRATRVAPAFRIHRKVVAPRKREDSCQAILVLERGSESDLALQNRHLTLVLDQLFQRGLNTSPVTTCQRVRPVTAFTLMTN